MRSLIDKGLDCDITRADTILPHKEEKLWENVVFGEQIVTTIIV